MRSRIKCLLVVASTLALAVGCEEPKEIIPVAPPGFEMTRIPTTPQGESQALGETASAAVVARQKQAAATTANSPPTPIGQSTTTASGLVYETLKEGTGPTAKSGDDLEMHYTGTLADGTKFDSSVDRGQPFGVKIGMGGVIPGWDEGIPGMKVGEKRKLTIPPGLAYGPQGRDKIPANSTLTFEVELLKIK